MNANEGASLKSVWLTRDEVAARLRIPPQTVAAWASKGTGPRFGKFGHHVRYKLADVEAWEESRMTGGAA